MPRSTLTKTTAMERESNNNDVGRTEYKSNNTEKRRRGEK
jgi:hypothetical protein